MVRDLWWRGLPASIRGQVWRIAAANELNVTSGSNSIALSSANFADKFSQNGGFGHTFLHFWMNIF